jgi:hypothetical protein
MDYLECESNNRKWPKKSTAQGTVLGQRARRLQLLNYKGQSRAGLAAASKLRPGEPKNDVRLTVFIVPSLINRAPPAVGKCSPVPRGAVSVWSDATVLLNLEGSGKYGAHSV